MTPIEWALLIIAVIIVLAVIYAAVSGEGGEMVELALELVD